jgi:flagellin
MGFRINTNIAALNAHTNSVMNNRNLDQSLAKLSSGLRINTAADDASGMAIADSLRSQSNSLGQAVANANDAIGIIQTADKAMDEQLKILDTIKVKAIQAASDNQSASSREAIQKDVNRLLEELDNIAKTTSFNGQQLLNGTYSNKSFQIGAYSNETINASIGNTQAVATGNLSTREDIAQLGNTGTVVSGTTGLGKGATAITLSSGAAGVAAGDTIRIDGVGNYKIEQISSATSTGVVTVFLDRGLEKSLSGTTPSFSLVSTAEENLDTHGAVTGAMSAGGDFTISFSDITGIGVGDVMQFTNSAGETMTSKVVSINVTETTGSGTVQFSGGSGSGGISASTNMAYSMDSRASIGSSFSGSDYVQYTVEGVELAGVQMTDENGYGVAGGGLGAVADQINANTSVTGIKAEALVEIDSQIKVREMTLTSDITINGETILSAGDTVSGADIDNKLVDAINNATSKTGVSASLESDGTLTLTSDGRAMNLSGLSGVAGINDGLHAGTLSITSNEVGAIDISANHFVDSSLTVASAGSNLQEIETSYNAADIISGRVDDSGDGVVDESDTAGLLRTQKGAMLTMDIVEAAISELDSVRADMGSVQNELVSTISNISVTQVNVKAAESQIRDVDFAAESANFAKFNILAQSGSYAMSQANAVQQNVLRLLQ